MPQTLIWTLLPNGFDPETGRARLSLVASPRLEAPNRLRQLADTPMVDWPGLVGRGLDEVLVRTDTGHELEADVVGPPPDAVLWSTIFKPSTLVSAPPASDIESYDSLVATYPYARALASARSLYEQAMRTNPTSPLPPDHPVTKAVAALGSLTAAVTGDAAARQAGTLPDVALDLLDPALTTDRLDRAVGDLEARGLAEEAAIAPLAAVVARHRQAVRGTGRTTAKAVPATPAPLDAVGSIENADVHQVIGLLLGAHPALARRLGLVVDLEVDATARLAGARAIRITRRGGAFPLADAFDVVRSMWSRVVCDPQSRRFLMADHSTGAAEMRQGLVDLRSDASDDTYVVSDLDVDAIARQLQLLGAPPATDLARSAGSNGGNGSGLVLPNRRDVGLRVAQARRAETTVAAALAAPVKFDVGGERIDGEAVLSADDVTAGYRVDVKRNGDPFRSLMRRIARYHTGPVTKGADPIEVHDEGMVEPIVAVQQTNGDGEHLLTVSEEIFAWSGYGLGAAKPGPVIVADGGTGATVDRPDTGEVPGYDLRIAVDTEPGSLPMLRFGDEYSFRLRGVTLAGDSLDTDDPNLDPDACTPPVRFRRLAKVAAPTIVPRRKFVDGETLTRLVVLSDGDGRPLGGTSERHLAAPSGTQELAERHGMFDAAFGPDTPERVAARRALLEIARRESGSFIDPVVPDTRTGRPVVAPGIEVIAPPGVKPARLPLPPGQPLFAGQYVIHDTDAPHLPYLADPAASGAALVTAADAPPVGIPYGGKWPAPPPARLVLRQGSQGDPDMSITPGAASGRGVLEVRVAPGREVTMALGSTLTPSAAAVMDQLPENQRDNATNGKAILLSQRQPITFLHATRRPVSDPVWTLSTLGDRPVGATKIEASGVLAVDGPSTGKVDLVTSWLEEVDPGTGPLLRERRQAVIGSYLIRPDESVRKVDIGHEFGDTRRRTLAVHAVSATRFADCFPQLPAGDPLTLRSGPAQELLVKNTTVPPRPRVHSVVPIYKWERSLTDGLFESTRTVAGLRVYLYRPWGVTGPKESLGVVAYISPQSSALAGDIDSPANDLVTRSGTDLVESGSSATEPMHRERFPVHVQDGPNTDVVTPPELSGEVNVDGKPGLVVVEHEVHFDEQRDLWYADIRFRGSEHFVRLGLVRYQPASTEGCTTSRIVTTDWVPLPVSQSVTVTRVSADAVNVSVSGTHRRSRRYTAALEPRLFDTPPGINLPPMDITNPDLGKSVVLKVINVPGPGETLAGATEPVDDEPPQIGPPPPPPVQGLLTIAPEQQASLRQGRIVVREIQEGEDIRFPGGADRTVWVETVDWAALFPDHKG